EAFEAFKRFNAIFSGLEPGAAQIEDDLMAMCTEIFNGGIDGRCNITGGGTESIYCAMLAMREWAKSHRPHVREPEFVAPYTAHISFSRAAHNFGLKIRRVPVGSDFRVRPADLDAAIGEHTVGMVASAPNWPYGLVDPIPEIAAIARRRDLWMHVDACVGGYVLPFAKQAGLRVPDFDLAVPGVCSISADLHKYGYVPKPCSTILWRSESYQRYHYYIPDDWPDGAYLSQSLMGSRPFAPTAAAWVILNSMGKEGFIAQARAIMATKAALFDGISRIDGLEPWCNDLPLMVVSARGVDITRVVGGMRERGWVLFGNEQPPSMHLTLDPLPDRIIESFLLDLRAAVESARGGGAAAGNLEYGLAKTPRSVRWIEQARRMAAEPSEAAGPCSARQSEPPGPSSAEPGGTGS
ncbi:MAG TPA: aminotransferase class V-fold PLP-dependent enzyme, partial [Steroidobacteraceae bacterium]|nr:aminotransferase class V-fold PLP-dependent enzyme [Steroidobacteraceae bacterium]